MKRIKSDSFTLSELKPWKCAEILLPEYSKAQFKDLEEFIVSGGQMPPVVISEDFRIIDGYNRWRMANRLSLSAIECDVYQYDDEKDMEHHAIVLNSKRRHLSNIQVARAASRLSDIFAQESLEDQVKNLPSPEPSEILPVSTTSLFVDETEAVLQAQEVVPITPGPSVVLLPMPKAQKAAMQKASRKLRVSSQTIERVQQVDSTNDGQLISAMETKQVSLKQAAELAVLPEEDRHRALEVIQNEKAPEAGNPKVVLNACSACRGRLKSCTKKLDLSLISAEKKEELKQSVQQVIEEANSLMATITNFEYTSPDQELPDSSDGLTVSAVVAD